MKDIVELIKEKLSRKILKTEEKSLRRVYIDIKKEDILEVVKILFSELGLRLATITGTDIPDGTELLYHFCLDKTGKIVSIRTKIGDKNKPEIESIAPLIVGAEWIEREIWELLGVNFKGHPNLKHLLLIDDWPEGKYPLRHKHEP